MGAWVQGPCRKWKRFHFYRGVAGTQCRARQGADEVKEKKAGPGPWGPYKPAEGSTFTQGQGEVWEGGGNRE